MIFRNTSQYATAEVRRLVAFAAGSISLGDVFVKAKGKTVQKHDTRPYRGVFYHGIPSIASADVKRSGKKHLITLGLAPPDACPYVDHYPDLYKKAKALTVADWREAVVYIAAHEARHLDQYRKKKPLSEVDAHNYAVRRVEAYRQAKAEGRLDNAEGKETTTTASGREGEGMEAVPQPAEPPKLAAAAERRSKVTNEDVVREFNARYPIGTPVLYWTGFREGQASGSGRTKTAAEVLSGHTPVVWIDGYRSCVALSHVQPLEGDLAVYWKIDKLKAEWSDIHGLPTHEAEIESMKRKAFDDLFRTSGEVADLLKLAECWKVATSFPPPIVVDGLNKSGEPYGRRYEAGKVQS